MTVWVTGARGFIGRYLSRQLARAGTRVVGVGHGTWPEAAGAGLADWLNSDVSAAALSILHRKYGPPDCIYHLAGGSSVGAALAAPREDFRRTVESTFELLEWMRTDAPRTALVVVSSAAVYGAGNEGLIDEATELRPCSPYGRHKLMMEDACRSYAASYATRCVIARLFSVFGAGLRKQLLWDLCAKLESTEAPPTLGGDGTELRDWTDVRDVARALVRVASLADSEAPTFNLGTGVPTSVADIAALVVSAWVDRGSGRQCRFNGISRPGDPRSLVADPSKLTALGFGWNIDLPSAIGNYVAWFRSRTPEFP